MFFKDIKFILLRYKDDIKVWASDIFNKIKFDYHKELALIEERPIGRLHFSVTNICNGRCVFCASRKISANKNYNRGVMSFEIFKKAVDEYSKLGGYKISLTPTIGEPLIDPGLIKKIDYAVNVAKIKKVYFYTNGTLLLKNNNYKKLVDSGIYEIDISTLIYSKAVYEKIYGISEYNEMLEGLYALLEYNKNRGEPVIIKIQFRTPKLPSETANCADFKRVVKPFLSEKVTYSFLVNYDNWGGVVKQSDLYGAMRLRRSFKFRRIPCLRTYGIFVLHDGSVRLCACRVKNTEFDELVVGNINDKSLKEIYNGKRAKSIRKKFLDEKLPEVCTDCRFYDSGAFRYTIELR